MPDSEKNALKAIDESELRLIDKAIDDEHFGCLSRLPLSTCGTYVATQVAYFRKALEALHEAKSAKNIENKRSYAVRAGSDLRFAVSSMKRRMETEEKEGELFHVDDHVHWPLHFSKTLEVRVSFRWRKTVDEGWAFGNITFHHEVRPRPVYTLTRPKRKPSAWKQEGEQQNELGRT